jgi:RimJ/RimL family protein N-acetyltransferase
MVPEGSTARLLLRPLEIGDAPLIQELFPHWEVVKFLPNRVPWPYPPDGAEQHLRNVALPQMERGEASIWSLRLRRDPNHLIGSINLRPGGDTNRGFWLGIPWQGQGLMSEACEWVNDFWFETLGFPVLRVSKAISNTASRRISEKQGMRTAYLCEKDYVCGRMLSEIWEITADEWRKWKAARNSGKSD